MMDLAELSRHLGISVPQARRRLEALSRHFNGTLAGKITKGPRGKILVDETVAALLREAEDLARESGITFTEAMRVLADQLNGVAETSRDPRDTLTPRTQNTEEIAQAIRYAGLVVGGALFLGLALLALSLSLR